jgi:hypothetical protein
MNSRIPVYLRAALAALTLAFCAGAIAAPTMPRFDQLEQRLHIRPDQKGQFDAAVAATQRALLAVAVSALEFKERLDRELAKPRPDFGIFFDAQQDLIERNRPLFEEAAREWQRLYALLDDKQVEVVKAFLRENLGNLLPEYRQ